jgi:protocatechuate 3,4-dioxygenase beta subunit
MRRPIIIALVLVAAIAALVVTLHWQRRGASPAANVNAAAAPHQTGRPPAQPRPAAGQAGAQATPLRLSDPTGDLRLEGIVVDEEFVPVPGARVALSAAPPRHVITGDDGTFVFADLAPGRYDLMATAEGKAAGPVATRLSATSEPVILTVAAAPAIEVHVTDMATAAAVPGAEVALIRIDTMTALTDDRGIARFAAVVPGGYALTAVAPGYGASVSEQFISEVTTELRLELARGAPLRGVVVDQARKGVSGARVTYEPAGDWTLRPGLNVHGVTTDARGRFEFAAIAAGTYRLLAHKPGYAIAVSAPVRLDGRHEESGMTLELSSGGTVTGRVVTADGRPAAGAVVRAAPPSDRRRLRQVRVDKDGRFTLTPLTREAMVIAAYGEAARSPEAHVDLHSATEPVELKLTLDVDGAISGNVVDALGEPVEGAQVAAWPVGGAAADSDLGPTAAVGTDSGGGFRFNGLLPGTYELYANPPKIVSRGHEWLRNPTIAKVGDNDVRIELLPEGRLVGRVAFEDDSPAPVFAVRFDRSFFRARPFANTDGTFALDAVPPGRKTLRITGPGFEPVTRPVAVQAGEELDLGTIRVRRGKSISGVVVKPDGAPIADAKVLAGSMLLGTGSSLDLGALAPGFQGQVQRTHTDQDGSFTLNGVGTGELNLVAEHPQYGRSAALSLPASSRSISDVRLVVEQQGVLEGTVTKDGAPAAGLVHAQLQTSPWAIAVVTSGIDGSYRFDNLAPGMYAVAALDGSNLPGVWVHSRTVTVEAGRAVRRNVTFGRGGHSLRVKVHGVDWALVFASASPVAAADGARLMSALIAPAENAYTLAIAGPSGTRIDGLGQRDHTLCAVQISGESAHPSDIIAALARTGASLRASCRRVAAEQLDGQAVRLELEADG